MRTRLFTPLRRASAALLAAAALLAPAAAPAGQLIQIPTADRFDGLTGEYLHRIEGPEEGYGTLLAPVGPAYELMFRYYNNEDGQHRIEGGGMIQILPDGIVTPGIALGVWDITNSSPWERRAFLVISKTLEQGQFGVPRPIEQFHFTVGVGTGRFSGLFAGARIDLPGRFSLVGEFDARRLNAGLWFTPVDPLTLRAELHNGNLYVGGTLRARF